MKLILLALLISAQGTLAFNYQWLTQYETTQNGNIVRFWGGDSLFGPVHSNDWIATQNAGGLPSFFDRVSTTKPSFRPGSPNPPANFYGGPPEYNARHVRMPESLDYFRTYGTWLHEEGMRWYLSLNGDFVNCYYTQEGTRLDTLSAAHFTITLSEQTVLYVDGRVDIRGTVSQNDVQVFIGSSQDIRIIDNVIIDGTNLTSGQIPGNATSYIVLASEQNVIIGNTPQNGRENRAEGSDVVITALVYALRGSFQIEQLNNFSDPYNCDCSPDERGGLILNGGIVQWRRGYLHNSNRGGTGYYKKFLFDERWRAFDGHVMPDITNVPDSLVFENTSVGSTTTDTVTITAGHSFSGGYTSIPFQASAFYQYAPPFMIPVSFTPPSAGVWSGLLTFFLDGNYHDVVLYGLGISNAPPIVPEIYPNPFNNVSTLSFTLPQSAHVRATVFDILGRETEVIADQPFIAGQHQISLNASSWSSGVYFLRLETLGQIETRKLMLIK